jgi:hypothetical protein
LDQINREHKIDTADLYTRASDGEEDHMLKYALAFGLVVVLGVATGSQETGCPSDPQRSRAAVQFARAVNTAQARFQAQNKRYGQISDLAVGAEPEGFHAQLTTDGTAYSFSVKDAVDACHFALFSDQQGLIYTARPLR